MATQKCVSVAEAIGDKPLSDPILPPEDLILKCCVDAEYVANAAISVGSHRALAGLEKSMNKPAFVAINGEHQGAGARIHAIGRPGRTSHHPEQIWRSDVR
jgi:hypothetical protein